MAALSVTNSFVAGTSIVASQMNANFTDVVNWAGGTPTLSTSGSTTTISGALTVTEVATFSDQIYLNGSNQWVSWEGSSADAHETFLVATNATADRTLTLPDATGTVALTSDITSPTWNDANNILTNSVFN
jgi:hypothetical protein